LDFAVKDPDFSDDGLPDPFRTYGGHVAFVFLLGVPLTHGDWTRTHEGECPSGCRKLLAGEPVATGPTHKFYTPETDPRVKQAIREAIARAHGRPLESPVIREVILPLKFAGDPYES